MTAPKLAVVGHPNKGKSSIVATLVRQDAVAISELSGTTTRSQQFSMQVDDETLYELIDTPGFQRPRQLLAILQADAENASQRGDAILRFLSAHRTSGQPMFQDEIELLTPIMQGTGIVYVVDGSLPYTPEYEAEMTILQWTGQPRMALINPIGGEQYIDEWQRALSQFFNVVRVFNPMTADHDKQKSVLSAFAELHEPWRQSLIMAQQQLDNYLSQLSLQAAQVIVEALQGIAQHESSLPLVGEGAEAMLKQTLRLEYEGSVSQMEYQMQRRLCQLFSHYQLQLQHDSLDVDYPDLFDRKSWSLFGLDRSKLVGLATSAGAAAGAAIDVGVGGSSLMAGAVAGGFLSGAATLFATLNPQKLKVKGMPLGGEQIVAGPLRDINLLFVLFGRAVELLCAISAKTHADRRVVVVKNSDFSERFDRLGRVDQVKLTRLLQRLHKGLSADDAKKLKQLISQLVGAD